MRTRTRNQTTARTARTVQRCDVTNGIAIVILWSWTIVLAAKGVAGFPPLSLTAAGFAISSLAVFFVRPPELTRRPMLWIGTVVALSPIIAYALATTLGTPFAGIAIQAAMLLAAFLCAMIGTDRLGAGHRAAFVIAAGVFLEVAAAVANRGLPAAVVIALIGARIWTFAASLVRICAGINLFALAVWSSALAFLPAAVLSLLLEGPPKIAGEPAHVRSPTPRVIHGPLL
jgi:O-acetylserine/cysteine efflux transporter